MYYYYGLLLFKFSVTNKLQILQDFISFNPFKRSMISIHLSRFVTLCVCIIKQSRGISIKNNFTWQVTMQHDLMTTWSRKHETGEIKIPFTRWNSNMWFHDKHRTRMKLKITKVIFIIIYSIYFHFRRWKCGGMIWLTHLKYLHSIIVIFIFKWFIRNKLGKHYNHQ